MANLSGVWEGVRSIDSIGKANRRARVPLWKPASLEADCAQRTDTVRRSGHRLERESFCNAIGKCDHSREYGNARDTEANALR